VVAEAGTLWLQVVANALLHKVVAEAGTLQL
jgi:hypothetical protein